MPKSGGGANTVARRKTERDTNPLVPVTVIRNVPGGVSGSENTWREEVAVPLGAR